MGAVTQEATRRRERHRHEPADRRTVGGDRSTRSRMIDLHFALAGGAVAAVSLFAGVAVVGGVTPYEGRELLEAVLPTLQFLTSAVMAAMATVLALMLTLLGITYTTEWTFRDVHFHRISQISLLASAAIGLSVVTLLFLGLPVGEAEGLRLYHHIVYYGLMAAASLLGGLTIAVVLMLHRSIRGLVAIGHSSGNSELINSDDPEKTPDRSLDSS